MLIVNTILILIISIIIIEKKKKNLTKIDLETKNKNKSYALEYSKLCDATFAAQQTLDKIRDELYQTKEQQAVELNNLKDIQDFVRTQTEESQKALDKAFESYCTILDTSYEEAEKLYDNKISSLEDEYNSFQNEIKQKINTTNKELIRIKNIHTAVINERLKEEAEKEKINFYCLPIKENNIKDIQILENIKPQLSNPRILSMLIWATFFQKEMTNLCNRVLGTLPITGIYKITNRQNHKCYIGQSTDVARRWKEHAKCGLGIDTPQGNKLYQEMQLDGIWNFSWELIESCSREELNEREKFYIEFYQSKDYGYNTMKGIN